jgi:hypothetical protein
MMAWDSVDWDTLVLVVDWLALDWLVLVWLVLVVDYIEIIMYDKITNTLNVLCIRSYYFDIFFLKHLIYSQKFY